MWRKVSVHHVKAAYSHQQLEAGNVQAVILVVLHCEEQRLFVSRYFNADLSAPDRHKRNKKIATVMATEGLEDMKEHLLPCHLP